MGYQHVETECFQTPKRQGQPCGDAWRVVRTVHHTTLILADGIGSGVRAHIAAEMAVARLAQLVRGGASLREAFLSVAGTMSQWRDHAMPFSAFALARVLNDGSLNVLSYEMPPPLMLTGHGARVMDAASLVVPAGLAFEHGGRLGLGDGVMMFSDGIVQAGLGRSLDQGWTADEVEKFLNQWPRRGRGAGMLAREVMRQAAAWDGELPGDDKSVLAAWMRSGKVVRVFTGPPARQEWDERAVAEFMDADGDKVLCGATTADVFSRVLCAPIEMDQDLSDLTSPPRSSMRGLDLVTEGVVTLTQVCNLLDEDLESFSDRSAAADLALMLKRADKVHFTLGGAANPANRDLAFRKQGILPRGRSVPKIAAWLEEHGKLVTVERL